MYRDKSREARGESMMMVKYCRTARRESCGLKSQGIRSNRWESLHGELKEGEEGRQGRDWRQEGRQKTEKQRGEILRG